MSDLILFVPGEAVTAVHLKLQDIRGAVYAAEVALSGMPDDALPFDALARLEAAEDAVHAITGPIKSASKRAHAARDLAALQSILEPEEPTDEQSATDD